MKVQGSLLEQFTICDGRTRLTNLSFLECVDNVFCKKFRDVFPPSVDLDGSKEQLNNIDKVLGVSVSVVMGVCKTYVC